MPAMPPRTLGNRGAATTAPQSQPAPAMQPAHRYAAPAPTGAAAPPARGRSGLPPAPTGWTPPAGGGGGFTRKTDRDWDADPLPAGEHEFDAYVGKVVAWNSGGTTLTWRVNQWDNAANRSGPQHGRPLRFDQQPRPAVLDAYLANPDDEDARKRYGYWRHDIVTAYDDAGFPEETWTSDEAGPVPPWDRFFVVTAGGLSVPVMFRVKVRAWRGNTASGADIKSMRMIKTADGRPFQAPLPREVPPGVAQMHRWRVAEERTIGDMLATVAVLDKESVPFPFNNMPTYKDL